VLEILKAEHLIKNRGKGSYKRRRGWSMAPKKSEEKREESEKRRNGDQ